MSEDALWDRIRDGMATRWHAQRHEDKYSTGIPDVSYGIERIGDGWIELKFLDRYPKYPNKPWDFALDHFTPQQRNWLEMRHRHGTGRVFVMAQFGDTLTAIWAWSSLRSLLGVRSFIDIERAASALWWSPRIDYSELAIVLASNRKIPTRYKHAKD